ACVLRLSVALGDIERRSGHQFVVALFQGLEGENLEEYSNRLFRSWRIGDARRNDGLLFALFKNDRKWRVEVGYGLEDRVTDLEAAELAREYGVPRFYAGDFDGGVQNVVAALGAKIGAPVNFAAESPGRRQPQPLPPAAGAADLAAFFILFFCILGIFLFIGFLQYRLGSRFRILRSSRWGYDDWSGGGWSGGSSSSWSGGGSSFGGGGDSGGFSGGGGSSG